MKDSDAVERSAQLWDAALEAVPGVFYVFDRDGRQVLWNQQFERVTGYTTQEVAASNPLSFFSDGDRDRVGEAIRNAFEHGYAEVNASIETRDGTAIPYHLNGKRFEHQRVEYVVGVGLDVSEQKRSREELVSNEALLRALMDAAHSVISVVSAEGTVRYQSPAVREVLGCDPSHIVGTSIFDLVHRDDVPSLKHRFEQCLAGSRDPAGDDDVRFQHTDGSWRCLSSRMSPFDEAIGGVVITAYDVTTQRAAERHVRYLALHDGLTGLVTRHLLEDRIDHALARCRRDGACGVLLFVDLDRFKNVNDSLGHAVGDSLLKAVAQRLRAHLRESDTLARHGGDEFVVLLEEISREEARAVASAFHDALSRTFEIEGLDIHISASIGVAMYPEDAQDAAEIIRHADMAMYSAKAAGRNQTRFYERAMSARFGANLVLEADLRKAVERDEFVLFYQPILDVGTLTVSAFEALLRWQHPERGLLLPGDFLRIAEEAGLMRVIGALVLRKACAQLAFWQRNGRDVRVAVNVSATDLPDGWLADEITQTLHDTEVDPSHLELELTENAVMDQSDRTLETLRVLNQLGVGVALDDFGTGYSSLSHLKRFRVDRLKIDRSFVRDLPQNSDDSAIVDAVLALGRAIGVGVVAEGVETAEQFNALRSRGCEEVQGFFFAPPLEQARASSFCAAYSSASHYGA